MESKNRGRRSSSGSVYVGPTVLTVSSTVLYSSSRFSLAAGLHFVVHRALGPLGFTTTVRFKGKRASGNGPLAQVLTVGDVRKEGRGIASTHGAVESLLSRA